MKKLYQTIIDPVNGNCFQTAIASLFEVEIEEVPDLKSVELSGGDWFAVYCKFIRTQGYELLGTIYNPNRKGMKGDRMGEFKTRYVGVNGVFHASVYSPRYYNPHCEKQVTHSILVDCDFNTIHDPNPNNQELKTYPESEKLKYNGILSVEIIEPIKSKS